jgi:hypothetical protein
VTDPLSDLLRTVRLTGAVFFVLEASSPWDSALPDGAALAPRLLPRSQRVISYHVVTGGAVWASVNGGPEQLVQAGDVLVFPHGDRAARACASVSASSCSSR